MGLIDTAEVMRSPPTKAEKSSYIKQGKRPPTGKGRAKIIGEAQLKGMKDLRFPNFKLATIATHGFKLFSGHPVYGKYFHEYKDEEFDYALLQPPWEDISEDNQVKIKDQLIAKKVNAVAVRGWTAGNL